MIEPVVDRGKFLQSRVLRQRDGEIFLGDLLHGLCQDGNGFRQVSGEEDDRGGGKGQYHGGQDIEQIQDKVNIK